MAGNAWREFATFTELTKEVQRRVNGAKMEQPFEDSLISDLIHERHYICASKGIRPHKFKKTYEDRPYRFYGYFDEIGWHPVSWRDAAAKTSRKKKEALSTALRLETMELKNAYRATHTLCERCGNSPPDDTHHEEPTWKEIVEQVIEVSGSAAVAEELSRWDWFERDPFRIQPEGRVKAVFDEVHSTAKLEALCKQCHHRA